MDVADAFGRWTPSRELSGSRNSIREDDDCPLEAALHLRSWRFGLDKRESLDFRARNSSGHRQWWRRRLAFCAKLDSKGASILLKLISLMLLLNISIQSLEGLTVSNGNHRDLSNSAASSSAKDNRIFGSTSANQLDIEDPDIRVALVVNKSRGSQFGTASLSGERKDPIQHQHQEDNNQSANQSNFAQSLTVDLAASSPDVTPSLDLSTDRYSQQRKTSRARRPQGDQRQDHQKRQQTNRPTLVQWKPTLNLRRLCNSLGCADAGARLSDGLRAKNNKDIGVRIENDDDDSSATSESREQLHGQPFGSSSLTEGPMRERQFLMSFELPREAFQRRSPNYTTQLLEYNGQNNNINNNYDDAETDSDLSLAMVASKGDGTIPLTVDLNDRQVQKSVEPIESEGLKILDGIPMGAEPEDEHIDYLPSDLEDDDFYLVGGSTGRAKSIAMARSLRGKRAEKSQVRTSIYFGGFFPWLSDKSSKSEEQDEEDNTSTGENGRSQLASGGGILRSSIDRSGSAISKLQLGKSILPAVRLALDHINANSSVLGPYKLEVVPRDTQCNATISLKQFFDMVYEEPKKMLLYGDACRVSTDPIAKASYFFDLIQISYADTDPIYTIENYPNFFRVVPSENALSLARIPFIRHFNWTRVGTIYQNLPRYSLPHSKLLTDLERFKMIIKQSVSLPGSVEALQDRDLGDELRKLKEKDVRIILGNFDEEWALLLFCEAFREHMTGRKYQWILTGFSEQNLWNHYKTKGSSCSKQELLIAMDGYIITDIAPVTRSQHPTVSGMMAHEYSEEYRRQARAMNVAVEENKFYGYVYDGIWAIALALNRVDSQLKHYTKLAKLGKVKLKPEFEGLSSLLDFEYHKPVWVKLIRDALNKTRFSGVTGTVSFQKNERPGLISFAQFQAFRDMSEVIIGAYDALEDRLDLKVGFPIFWRGHSPPIDYTIQRVTSFRINRTLFVIISIFALFGIVLAFVFLFINIKFRNQRYIKMSSPYLNNLIIIGCILTYTSVIILGLDSGLTSEYNFPYICNARAWVLMAGFTLAFGSMFSKTFRVHSIFTNIKLHKKVIKDYKLFMVVFILLTFDVCILIVWQHFDPFYRETNNGTSIQDADNEDILIVPEMEHCQSKRMTIFLSVIYVYKGLLMAFGCFLAWETRHVSIPALNDSKYIGLSVYNVVIMCVIGASLSFILRDQQDASFVIISIFIIFCSTTTLCLVFVPKVRMLIELKQNPRAGDHRVRATLKTFKKNYHEDMIGAANCRDAHGNIVGRGFGVNLNERIKVMFDENIKQRTLLKEKTYELEALTSKYRKIQNMVQSGQYLKVTANMNGTDRGSVHSSSIGNLANALQLTSRSPVRERVSFSVFNNGTSNVVAQTIRDAKNNINSKLCDFRTSPVMSSVMQITTTNTTSSTMNNATDTTTDYSSSNRFMSTTTSTNSGPRVCPDEFTCKNMRFSAAFIDEHQGRATNKCLMNHTNNSAHCNLNSVKTPLGPKNFSEMNAPGGAKQMRRNIICSMAHNSQKFITDSSYCSMGDTVDVTSGRVQMDDTRLSCPDISAKFSLRNQRNSAHHLKKQTSEKEASKSKERSRIRSQLPRTMSMIEYIATHEDKAHCCPSKRRMKLDCCFEVVTVCNYCDSSPYSSSKTRNQSQCDVGLQSSSEMVGLTSSFRSCSTCCSLGSATYPSRSYDESSQSSQSLTSQRSGSSASGCILSQRIYSSNSQSSTERSTSIVAAKNGNRALQELVDKNSPTNSHEPRDGPINQELDASSSNQIYESGEEKLCIKCDVLEDL